MEKNVMSFRRMGFVLLSEILRVELEKLTGGWRKM
jgi:hypothetical protein